MARKRQGIGGAGDALELFLDTICNAFGGIIFISLLICVMLQLSGKAAQVAETDPMKQLRRENELRKIQDEISRLINILRTQLTQLETMKSKTDPDRYRKYLKLVKEEEKVRKDNHRLSRELAGIRIERDKQRKRFLKLIDEKEQWKKRKEILEEKLAKMKKRRGLNLSVPPGARRTRKKPVPLLLTGKRLVFVMEYNDRGRTVTRNDKEANFKKIAPEKVVDGKKIPAKFAVTAKPNTGIAVEAGAGLEELDKERPELIKALGRQLNNTLKKFSSRPTNRRKEKDCHFFHIFVWPDSFGHFEVLRDLLIKRGFEYGLVLMKEGESAITGIGDPDVE